MIPYEDLCAALEAYAARTRGVEPPAHAPPSRAPAAGPSDYDPPTSESMLPEEPRPSLRSHGGHNDADADATHVGSMGDEDGHGEPPPLAPVFDDKSNELDIGDVLSDEENHS